MSTDDVIAAEWNGRHMIGEHMTNPRLLVAAVVLSIVTTACTGAATAPTPTAASASLATPQSSDTLIFQVIGDMPYGTTPADNSQTIAMPSFLNAINGDTRAQLLLHVGDIHSGKQYCTREYNQQIFDVLAKVNVPLVYTPGDNEWSDCHKLGEGGGEYNKTTGKIDYVTENGKPVNYELGDPIANLALVRSMFFPKPGVSLGRQPIPLISQALQFDKAFPNDAKYVENVMWKQANTLFVAINLPGGSNNDLDIWYGAPTMTAAQTQETTERTGADLRWLDAAFAKAKADGVAAMVIMWQADVWDPEKGADHQTGYEPLVKSLATKTADFGKPVLMFNGDSHEYKSDNPFAPTDPAAAMHPGYDVKNFRRVVVHGSTAPMEWLNVIVNPRLRNDGPTSFGPFSWTRIVPKI